MNLHRSSIIAQSLYILHIRLFVFAMLGLEPRAWQSMRQVLYHRALPLDTKLVSVLCLGNISSSWWIILSLFWIITNFAFDKSCAVVDTYTFSLTL